MGEKRGGHPFHADGFPESCQRIGKDKIPDVTQNNAADDIGRKKSCPEKSLSLYAACHRQSQQKSYDIAGRHREHRIDHSL